MESLTGRYITGETMFRKEPMSPAIAAVVALSLHVCSSARAETSAKLSIESPRRAFYRGEEIRLLIKCTNTGEDAIQDYNKGDVVKAIVLDVDQEKERISLGIKQLGSSPAESASAGGVRKGATVTCEVTEVQENGIEVSVAGTEMTAFIRRSDLARDRSEQRPERFAVGEKVDARVTQFDKNAGKIGLSIKALEIAEEKAAVEQYGSSDSGASLGDILGAALNKAKDEDGDS